MAKICLSIAISIIKWFVLCVFFILKKKMFNFLHWLSYCCFTKVLQKFRTLWTSWTCWKPASNLPTLSVFAQSAAFFYHEKKNEIFIFPYKLMIRITIFAFTVWIHTKPRSVFALYFPYYLSPVIRKCTDKYMWLAKIWISQHSHTVWSFFSKNSIRLCSSHHKNMPI